MPDYVEEMLDYITENASVVDTEQRYRDMLDECYSFKDVGGPFAYMQPSRVLEEMGPVTFRCGMNDYNDGDTVEIRGNDYDSDEVERLRDQFIEEKEEELSEAHSEEVADWEDAEPDIDDCDRRDWALAEPDPLDLSILDSCRKYVF